MNINERWALIGLMVMAIIALLMIALVGR